jgi:hypothetical protein
MWHGPRGRSIHSTCHDSEPHAGRRGPRSAKRGFFGSHDPTQGRVSHGFYGVYRIRPGIWYSLLLSQGSYRMGMCA